MCWGFTITVKDRDNNLRMLPVKKIGELIGFYKAFNIPGKNIGNGDHILGNNVCLCSVRVDEVIDAIAIVIKNTTGNEIATDKRAVSRIISAINSLSDVTFEGNGVKVIIEGT